MASPDATTATVIGTPIQLALGLNFVRTPTSNLPLTEGPQQTPAEQALNNVVPMTAQYQWLAVKAQTQALRFDPGVKHPTNGYPIAGFITALNLLLNGLVDPGISYTAETFLTNHVLKEGRWVPGRGHLFKLLADGMPLVLEARVQNLDFHVEILMSVEVVV